MSEVSRNTNDTLKVFEKITKCNKAEHDRTTIKIPLKKIYTKISKVDDLQEAVKNTNTVIDSVSFFLKGYFAYKMKNNNKFKLNIEFLKLVFQVLNPSYADSEMDQDQDQDQNQDSNQNPNQDPNQNPNQDPNQDPRSRPIQIKTQSTKIQIKTQSRIAIKNQIGFWN